MLSKIDGGFHHMLEDTLKVKGVESNPQQFDSDVVKPVIDLTQGGFSQGYNARFATKTNIDLNTKTALAVNFLTVSGLVASGSTDIVATLGENKHGRILAAYLDISVTAGSLAALVAAGERIGFNWRINSGSTLSCPLAYTEIAYTAGKTYEVSCLYQLVSLPVWIPFNGNLNCRISNVKGTAWGVGDKINAASLVYVERSMGTQLPL